MPGERLDHLEAVASACHEQRVAARVGQNGYLEAVCAPLVQRGALRDARVHELLNVRGDEVGVGIFERHDADVAELEGQLLVELPEEPLDDGEALPVARYHQRARPLVHGDDRLVLGPHLGGGARAVVEVLQDLLQRPRIRVVQRVDAHRFQPAGRRDVELVDDIPNERQHVRARGDDEDIREIVGLENERGAGLRRLRGVGGAPFLERAQARHLGAHALRARHRGPLGEDALQERQHFRRARVLEAEQFHLRDEAFDRLVEIGDQLEREVHRFDLAAEDDGVGARVDRHVQRIDQGLPLRAIGLRVGAGRAGGQLPALRENGREHLGDRRGFRELERLHLDDHVLEQRHGVHHGNHPGQRLEVVGRGGQDQPVAATLAGDGIGGDLDWLGEIEQHRLARLVPHFQAADLFLELARLGGPFALRAGLEHVLQHRGELGRIRLL